MKQIEIINKLKDDISYKAYRATCCDELKDLNFDVGMMEWHAAIYKGEAFEAIELLNWITGSQKGDELFEKAEEEARQDIKAANYDLVKILNMAGFDGEAYYEANKMYA